MRPVPPPPSWLNLGDLDSVKVGDTVVCLEVDEKKKEITWARIRKVYLVEDWRVLTRAESSKSAWGWVRKNKGVSVVMGGPPHYFSVNPEHILLAQVLAEKNARQAALNAERKKIQMEALERRKLLARRAGEMLGDGEIEDDEGEVSYSDTVASNLVDRLTDEQIRTLTMWLENLPDTSISA